MALKGTLKDFGIADILQLIGHQLKTGVLKLTTKSQEVRVTFVEGNVVKAESATREKSDLLGSLMARAEVLTQQQLDTALEIQRRTLKRLGDILVDSGYVSREVIREFTRLQTTETIYKLFIWKTGNYEFEQGEVDHDPQSYESIRAESVLMEGFRMVDEWPFIRKRINSYAMTFEILKPLPEDSGDDIDEDAFLSDIDDAFNVMDEVDPDPKPKTNIGDSERLVYSLVKPERDVQKIIDLSRMGEFETCKGLLNLLTAEVLAAVPAKKGAEASAPDEGGALAARRASSRIVPLLVRVATTTVLLALVLVLIRVSGFDASGLWQSSGDLSVNSAPIEEALGWRGEERISRALELYFLENGGYPQDLEALISAELLGERELSHPWRERYVYRSNGRGYLLKRPFR